MTLIQKSVTINALVENVLAILEDPERQSELEGEPEAALLPAFPAWILRYPLGIDDSGHARSAGRVPSLPMRRASALSLRAKAALILAGNGRSPPRETPRLSRLPSPTRCPARFWALP